LDSCHGEFDMNINEAGMLRFGTIDFQQVIYHFEGILMENEKKITHFFLNLCIPTHFASTGHIVNYAFNP